MWPGNRALATGTDLRCSPAIEIGKLQPGPIRTQPAAFVADWSLCRPIVPSLELPDSQHQPRQASGQRGQASTANSEMTDQQVHQASSAEKHELVSLDKLRPNLGS